MILPARPRFSAAEFRPFTVPPQVKPAIASFLQNLSPFPILVPQFEQNIFF